MLVVLLILIHIVRLRRAKLNSHTEEKPSERPPARSPVSLEGSLGRTYNNGYDDPRGHRLLSMLSYVNDVNITKAI